LVEHVIGNDEVSSSILLNGSDMSFEAPNNNELVERSVLVDALKTRGIEDSETRELLIRWTEEQERKVEELRTREAQIQFEINRAELYIDSGFHDEGRGALEDALIIASQEELGELVEMIESKLSSL
jgi:hypothetical protein